MKCVEISCFPDSAALSLCTLVCTDLGLAAGLPGSFWIQKPQDSYQVRPRACEVWSGYNVNLSSQLQPVYAWLACCLRKPKLLSSAGLSLVRGLGGCPEQDAPAGGRLSQAGVFASPSFHLGSVLCQVGQSRVDGKRWPPWRCALPAQVSQTVPWRRDVQSPY